MAQLVHDDVVEDPPRCEHEPPRERQRAFRRARPETRTRVADGDSAIPNPDAWGLCVDRLPHEPPGEVAALALRQLRWIEHSNELRIELSGEPRGVRTQRRVDRAVTRTDRYD